MIELKSGEQFLWRPMLAGWVSYRDIVENRVDLCALDEMNELLDVQAINDRRMQEYYRQRDEAGRG